jgi:predicted nucleic acid-binding Zn ribbon protein
MVLSVEHPVFDDHPTRHNEVKIGDDEPSQCDGLLERKYGRPAITFKGEGFYSTDKALHNVASGDYESDNYVDDHTRWED